MKNLLLILNTCDNFLKNPLYTPTQSWVQWLGHYAPIVLGVALIFISIMIILSIIKFLTVSDEKKENFRNWLAVFSWFGAGMIALAFFEKFGVPYLVWHCNQQIQEELLVAFGVVSILLLRTFVQSKLVKNLGKFELF